jgi:hypothetical protein
MVEPTAEELESLIPAARKLWELDENRLTPGIDYAINVQARWSFRQHQNGVACGVAP